MTIIPSEPFEFSARDKAIAEIAILIEDAVATDEEVSPYSLAVEIADSILPPVLPVSRATAIPSWLDRQAAEVAEPVHRPVAMTTKPRVRVTAATQWSVAS